MTEPGLIEPDAVEEPADPDRDHPPFRMRERRLMVLPDLRPPSLDELRWAARERRRRRDAPAPEQRRPVSHERIEPREPADVPATSLEDTPTDTELLTIELPEAVLPETVLPETVLPETVLPETVLPDEATPEAAVPADTAEPAETAQPTETAQLASPDADIEALFVGPEPEPAVAEAAIELAAPPLDPDFHDLHDPEFPDLRPWRPLVLPDPEPVAETESGVAPVVVEPEPEPVVEPQADLPRDDGDTRPLVSQVLVVREPVAEPGRIAVLDEVDTDTLTITRLVPLPADDAAAGPIDDVAVDAPGYEDTYVEELEDLEPELEVTAEVDDRTAPLYWRLLRLRHTRPNGWLRALYFEGSVALSVVLVLAEAASVWTIVVLPVVVAVVVKANDVLAGSLRSTYRQPKRRTES